MKRRAAVADDSGLVTCPPLEPLDQLNHVPVWVLNAEALGGGDGDRLDDVRTPGTERLPGGGTISDVEGQVPGASRVSPVARDEVDVFVSHLEPDDRGYEVRWPLDFPEAEHLRVEPPGARHVRCYDAAMVRHRGRGGISTRVRPTPSLPEI